tara:strand:- start:24504 stop:26447 length:1944 start_codon:yes stop_codon:yes gene_type:complete
MDTLGAMDGRRTKPRLWVEKLWILDSLSTPQPLREITLTQGLNLIVSPQSHESSGHGVGKTAFCQLLRFILNDPQWSDGTSLKSELLQNSDLKKGAVAALVHIGEQRWTVLKPWQHQQQYKASRTADWQQLASNEEDNEFGLYQAALIETFVNALPIQQLPGSDQAIEWHHILAWCSRAQNARYQSYYQWRATGTGFSLPAKSPAVLLQILLGLVDDGKALQALEAAKQAVDTQKRKLQALREEPALLMAHVRRQLDRRLNTNKSVPFRQTDLFERTNLVDLARQRLSGYLAELEGFSRQLQDIESERQLEIENRAPLNSAIGLVSNEISQLEAIVTGNQQELERLINEAQSLQQKLPTRCDPGNRLLRDCDHVVQRVQLIQIDRSQQANEHKRHVKEIEKSLFPLKRRLEELEAAMLPIDQKVSSLNQKMEEVLHRQVEITAAKELLQEAIEDYEHYENIIQGKEQTNDIRKAEIRLAELKTILGRCDVAYENVRSSVSERKKIIGAIMNDIAKYLPMFRWGVFNSDDKSINRPFQLGPPHSTTYGVLEILAGDIACLLDSRNDGSLHPGLLIHDSPREAEMSEDMLWTLLNSVPSNDGQFFQYIVTTSTEAIEGYSEAVRLRLDSSSNSKLLFKQPLAAEQGELN